ncbi:hypothetical protein COV20_05040 [Candidatus Woesearchaeota archaeon CG10_big_fil_rev_8_21_14_0_10_45_16]|nr:MAG: hypothetical protein COV20_05040 [Candidatus Woesearchaeota archaeon CG10_big_fil_rev_8_21_14_0_10_45_16]
MAPELLQEAQNYLYTIISSVVILLVGFGLGILAKKFLSKVLKEVELNKIMSKVGITSNVEKGISTIASYVIYLVTVLFFLENLGVTSYVVYLVVGGMLMLLILTLLVGLKDVIPNFFAWTILRRKVKEGSRIEVREISGRVERVGYLETEIKTENGDVLYVPNSLFVKSKMWVRN